MAVGIALVSAVLQPVAQARAQDSAPAWLTRINTIRAASGLDPVTINPAWDAAIQKHLRYLARTPQKYKTGQYASMHTENPQSPYYTKDGAYEGLHSNLIEGAANGEVNSINTWLSGPFHALGILRPGLKQVALVVDRDMGVAGLDVLSGLDQSVARPSQSVLFPGDGSTIDIPVFGGNEIPDPINTCGGNSRYPHPGLPLVALLPTQPASDLSASLTGPNGTADASGGDLCIVDQHTYVSDDPTFTQYERDSLAQDHAVFLVPRQPLRSGHYVATIRENGQPDITWSFDSSPQTRLPQLQPARDSCAWSGHSDGSLKVAVIHMQDYAKTGQYTIWLDGVKQTTTVPDLGVGYVTYRGLSAGPHTLKAKATYDELAVVKLSIPACTPLLAASATIGRPDWSHHTVPVTLDNRHNRAALRYDVFSGQGSQLTTGRAYRLAAGAIKNVTAHLTSGHQPTVLVVVEQRVVDIKRWKH